MCEEIVKTSDLESAVLENIKKAHINICMGCKYAYPECPAESQDALFGNYDNICACAKFEPYIFYEPMPLTPKEENKSGN